MGNAHNLYHRRHCGHAPAPLLLGRDGDHPIVGLPRDWFERARKPALRTVDGIGLGRVQATIHPDHGHEVPDGPGFFGLAPDKLSQPIDLALRFSTPADSAVALTSLKAEGSTRILRVTRNAESVDPDAQSDVGWLWLGGGRKGKGDVSRGELIRWTIWLRTDVPQWVDVVAF